CASDGRQAKLTSDWTTAGTPPDLVTFNANGTNAAKNVVATFTKAGSYAFQVMIRDQSNLTATSSVNVTVNATVTTISVAPSSVKIGRASCRERGETAEDECGVAKT